MIAYLIGNLAALSEWYGRMRAAHAKGYKDMSWMLNAAYSGPMLEYDHILVSNSRNKLLGQFVGSSDERTAYAQGIRDAVVTYEREFGAP